MTEALARTMWTYTEPIHAVSYFSPEVREALTAAGTKGFWMGYFASRAAPLGAVGPEVVEALFYGFAPARVRRALPDAWGFTSPEAVLEARERGVDAALRRLLGDVVEGEDVAAAAALARRAAEACPVSGRALFAAHAALPWPQPAHLQLWHAATLLREFRGDGHVAALVVAGLDPVEAHVLAAAASGIDPGLLQQARGWDEHDWADAQTRLRARGWLDGSGAPTADGVAVRDVVETTTDRLASPPFAVLADDERARLLELLERIVTPVVAAGEIPYPNPIGAPRPGG